MYKLSAIQEAAIDANGSSFLLGPTGTGKSTTLWYRLLRLLSEGEPAYTILVLVAESEHAQPFLETIFESGLGPYAELEITTYLHMARQLVNLFWPLVARPSGFDKPYRPPTFLSYDLAQLYMWQTTAPMFEEGAFADLRLRPQQVVSQLLDTLNRAALNNLSLQEASERQIAASTGGADQVRHFEDAATAAGMFRQACLDNSLLDLSLVVEVFNRQLVNHKEFRRYFSERYRHLIVDNVEEQTPAGQRFIASLMNSTETTAIAYDAGGGYKRFLAADPAGANQFRQHCSLYFEFDRNYTATTSLRHLSNMVENTLMGTKLPTIAAGEAIIDVVEGRYRREMVIKLASRLRQLIDDGTPADHIAIITPYLDGALRYSLTQSLKEVELSYYLLRRRSSPRDEPRVRAWLTWLALAHPEWGIKPSVYDVSEAYTLTIAGIDPARAHLIAERLYVPDGPALMPADELPERIIQRVGRNHVTLAEDLRLWLDKHGGGRYPIDIFLHRLFHSLLAQPRFQPKPDLAGAAVCDWLVKTASRLRQAADPMGLHTPSDLGQAFISGIYQGLVTANPPELGEPPDTSGIMISTIYGYLLAGRPVKIQVWLETAATGWWDIPNQRLSNAFVLTSHWHPGQQWTMEEDFKIRNQLLSRLVRGLVNRCSESVILATSDLDRRGLRQDGPLWRALVPVRD